MKLKYLCSGPGKHLVQSHLWMAARRKKLTYPLWSLAGTWLYPFPFSCKRSQNSNSGTLVLWDTSPSSSQSAGFLNKVTIPRPNNSSVDLLVCRVVSSTSLNLVIVLKECDSFETTEDWCDSVKDAALQAAQGSATHFRTAHFMAKCLHSSSYEIYGSNTIPLLCTSGIM